MSEALVDRLKRVTLGGVALIIAIYILLFGQLMFLSPAATFHPVDEGYIAAFVWRMVDGSMLPYVDAVSHRGPLCYLIPAGFAAIVGPDSYLPVRLSGLLTTLAPAVLIYAAAARAGKREAGGLAALGYAYMIGLYFPRGSGLAYNAENVLNMFALLALWQMTAALDTGRERPCVRRLFVAGIAAACAGLGKQVGLVMLPVFGLWVLASALAREGLAKQVRIRMVVAYCAGAAVPALLFVVWYGVSGELSTFYYYFYTYNTDVYMGPFTARETRKALSAWVKGDGMLLILGALLVSWVAVPKFIGVKSWSDVLRRFDKHGFAVTAALSASVSLVGAKMGLRDFGHYFVQVVPWFALLLAMTVSEAMAWLGDSRRVRLLVLAPPFVVLLIHLLIIEAEHRRLGKRPPWWMNPSKAGTCKVVDKYTEPDDSMFVWGFEPYHYINCKRRPATRYVFTTFVQGFVPWFYEAKPAEEQERSVPGSWDILLDELDAAEPRILVEAPIKKRPMKNYAAIWEYVEQHYCSIGTVHDQVIYLRLRPDGECPEEPGKLDKDRKRKKAKKKKAAAKAKKRKKKRKKKQR